MLANVRPLPPRCPECSRPMQLVHVHANAHVYPPVRTFECAPCEKDMICQWQPTPADQGHTRQFVLNYGATLGTASCRAPRGAMTPKTGQAGRGPHR
jgi:hypothetical protein